MTAQSTMDTAFHLPELPRLLPVAYHPKAAQIEIASNGWVRRWLADCFPSEADLLQFLRQRNGIYGPLTVPEADERRAQDIADWYQYVTVIDSFVSDRSALGASDGVARQLFDRLVDGFGGDGEADGADGEETSSGYAAAAGELWRRISPGFSAGQRERFTASLAAFLRGCTTEISAKLAGEVPDYETCLAVRLDSFGCDFIELMTEYAAEVDMTDRQVELAEVHTHCMRQLILVNDLLSWRKEWAQDDKMTVVRVLVEREGLALQDAVDRMCELVESHERAYLAARDALLGRSAELDRYLRGLDHLIGGSQEFEYLTPRYFGDGAAWDGSTSGWVDLTAETTRFLPLRPTPAATAAVPAAAAAAPAPVAVPAARSAPGGSRPAQAGECPVPHAPSTAAEPGPDRLRVAYGREPAADRDAKVPRGPGGRPAAGGSGAPATFARAPGALPVLGHALQLWRRPLEFVASLPACADLVEVRLGPRRAYLAASPELTMAVLMDARTYDKGGPLFDKARALVGNGLVSSGFDDHRTQRRMLQPAFHPSRMPTYAAVMQEEIDAAVRSWRPGVPFDVSDEMHALTLRITARTIFATTVGDRTVEVVSRCMPLIMRGVYQRMVAPLGWQEKLPTPSNRRYNSVRAEMHEVISETIRSWRQDGSDHGDLLSILVGGDGHGEGLTDDEVYDQVMTLLIGGTETTGNTMAWAFHLLSGHPEVERRLHEELDTVLGGRLPDFADLPRLDYTWRVLTETLRMYPPAWLLTRVTTRATELAGHPLPAGAIVLYSPYALSHDPRHFPDPERFDPDRWLPERSKGVPRGAMVPFSAGNRQCIGESFGQAETTLALAGVASRWRLRAGTQQPGTGRPRASLGTGPLFMTPEPLRQPVG
ncbi:MAG: cytochrome P450 [Jatrophihabitantaceae bacterium]